MGDALTSLARVVRKSGLVAPGSEGIVLVSGGPDSGCALAGLAEHCGAGSVTALHLDYRLRPDSGEDARTCAELCERLGVELVVVEPDLEPGNVQEAARDARYAAAERFAEERRAAWIATGHTRTDVAETVLFRLASSPGHRALLGLPPRRGRIVRPLLALGREETRRLAEDAELPFRDDPSNLDPAYARNRIRLEALPALREVHPSAEDNLAETRAELAEEAELLDRVVSEALVRAGAETGNAIRAEAMAGWDPALSRLALRSLAERAARRRVPLSRGRAAEILRLAGEPEGGEVDLGRGLRAICEHGLVRFAESEDARAEPRTLSIPGSCRFAGWELRAEVRKGPVEPAGPDVATLDAGAVGGMLEVRPWREGDRMRPLGMEGTKTLQDLFTDARVPRSLRRRLPVVTAADRIAWVAGVAVGEEFKMTPDTTRVVVISARAVE